MISELEPVWKQWSETCDALRDALAQVPDERLHWRPAPAANTVARIVQHIARANLIYANISEHGSRGDVWELEDAASRQRLLQRLDESEQRARAMFEHLTPEVLRQTRADRWGPLGPEVTGPLDALWFALQIVRHSAYHLGQINLYLLILEGEGTG